MRYDTDPKFDTAAQQHTDIGVVSVKERSLDMLSDKRKFIRFSIALDAAAKRVSWTRPRDRYSVKDISRGGFKIGSKAGLNPGDILELELMVPGRKKPIMAAGQVAWSHGSGSSGYDIGLKFKTIKPEEKFELLDLAYNNWVSSQKAADKILKNL